MADAGLLPESFRFGVATNGFQNEGGYNGLGEPRNNWFRWEAEGRVEPSGVAVDFWNDYEAHLDRAAGLGCDTFGLSVEWARCEPADGELDDNAFDRYRSILDACRERGMEPLVALHHFTHPWWLGEGFWLDDDSPERLAGWATTAVERLGTHCRFWTTVDEANILALQSYFTGDFPPGRIGRVREALRALDHLGAAHVLAYEEIKARHTDAVVSTNPFTFTVYDIERLLTDIWCARSHGITRDRLHDWLAERRAEHFAAVEPLAGQQRFWQLLGDRLVGLEQAFPRTVDAAYASAHDSTLDVSQVDYYAPFVSSHFAWPGRLTSGGRAWLPTTDLWDDRPDPAAFARLLPLSSATDREIWLVENGLCNRVRKGRSYPRLDGWDRPRYLRAHLREIVGLIEAGVPIGAYLHWTLVDNYEWGSYEPRFGIYGVDRARGNAWSDTDAMGHDAATAYRRLIEGLRAGDRSVLADPLG